MMMKRGDMLLFRWSETFAENMLPESCTYGLPQSYRTYLASVPSLLQVVAYNKVEQELTCDEMGSISAACVCGM